MFFSEDNCEVENYRMEYYTKQVFINVFNPWFSFLHMFQSVGTTVEDVLPTSSCLKIFMYVCRHLYGIEMVAGLDKWINKNRYTFLMNFYSFYFLESRELLQESKLGPQKTERKLRQRCVSTPDVFNLYNEMNSNGQEVQSRFNIVWRHLNIICLTDDNVLMTHLEIKEKEILDKLVKDFKTEVTRRHSNNH